jgi:uncharacterized protein involved in tellurium resistance
MKSIVLTLLLLLGAWTAAAADLSGRWTGTIDVKENGESRTVPVLLILKQEGTKLTGSGGGSEDDQHAILKGSVEGDKVTIEAEGNEHGNFHLELKVDGDQMTGDVRRGDSERMKMTLKRT